MVVRPAWDRVTTARGTVWRSTHTADKRRAQELTCEDGDGIARRAVGGLLHLLSRARLPACLLVRTCCCWMTTLLPAR